MFKKIWRSFWRHGGVDIQFGNTEKTFYIFLYISILFGAVLVFTANTTLTRLVILVMVLLGMCGLTTALLSAVTRQIRRIYGVLKDNNLCIEIKKEGGKVNTILQGMTEKGLKN